MRRVYTLSLCQGHRTRISPAQVLPFASEETLSTLESNIASFGAVSERLQDGLTARQIVSQLLGSLEAPEQGFALTPR